MPPARASGLVMTQPRSAAMASIGSRRSPGARKSGTIAIGSRSSASTALARGSAVPKPTRTPPSRVADSAAARAWTSSFAAASDEPTA